MTQLDELVSAVKSLDTQAPPPEAETRMWTKIAAQAGGATALGLAAATLGAKTASASTAAASTAAASTAAASTSAVTGAAVSGVATSSLALTVAKVGAALALTAGLGIGAVKVASKSEPQTQAVASGVLEAEPVVEPLRPRRATARAALEVEDLGEAEDLREPPSPPEPVVEVAAQPRARRAPSKAPVAKADSRPEPDTSSASSLAAESALLGKARVASSSGRNLDALAALREHAKLHPKGELAEVRRALEVRVLCELGRHQAARDAAAKFLAKHHASALAGQVRSRCAFE